MKSALVVLGVLLCACGDGLSATTENTLGAATRPRGTLWHNNSVLDRRQGLQVAFLGGGAPLLLDSRTDIDFHAWPDGRQFVIGHRRASTGTRLTVFNTASGAVVYDGRLAGYVRGFEPSPVDKRLLKVRQSATSAPPSTEYVLDLSTMRYRYRIPDDDWFSWMPDGRFMLISLSTGKMRIGSLDSTAETTVGRLTVPADRSIGPFLVSPRGTKLLVSLTRRGSNEADLWMANIDGTAFEQFTDTKAVAGAAWSPDGNHVAYSVDTGFLCSPGAGCAGSCTQWYAAVDQRKSRGLAGTPGSGQLMVSNRGGASKPLGCSVLAWTP